MRPETLALHTVLASGLALGLAGCQGAAAPATVPQAVADVLAARCVECHSDPTVGGAPMPLATYDAFHAAAVTQPASPVYQLVGTRIHDPARPMPPTAPLSAAELANSAPTSPNAAWR